MRRVGERTTIRFAVSRACDLRVGDVASELTAEPRHNGWLQVGAVFLGQDLLHADVDPGFKAQVADGLNRHHVVIAWRRHAGTAFVDGKLTKTFSGGVEPPAWRVYDRFALFYLQEEISYGLRTVVVDLDDGEPDDEHYLPGLDDEDGGRRGD